MTVEQLQRELEMALEADDATSARKLMARIRAAQQNGSVELATDINAPKEGPMNAVVNATQLGLTDTAAPAAGAITKEMLGIKPGSFKSALKQLSEAEIRGMIVPVTGTEDLAVLIVPGVSKLDAAHRIHVQSRGDAKRAFRGAAIVAGGGVQPDGSVISATGTKHRISGGQCFEIVEALQVNSDGSTSKVEGTKPCMGHLDYQKSGDRFVATGKEYMRCKHSWALAMAQGYFVSFSMATFSTIAFVEIAQSVGDEAARQAAGETIETWSLNAELHQAVRRETAQAINYAHTLGNVTPEGRLAPRGEALNLKLADGSFVKDAILALKGQRFRVEFAVPLSNGAVAKSTTRMCNTPTDLADAAAPLFATAEANNGVLEAVRLIAC
jgi:hypothetical protein